MNIGKDISGDFSVKSKEIWNTLKTKYFLEDTQTEPMVSLIANDSGVQCTLRYIVTYNKRRITKTEIFSLILKEIDATNGEIKFASEIVPV